MAPWKDAGSRAGLQKLEAVSTSDGHHLEASFQLPVEATELHMTYCLLQDGRAHVDFRLELGKTRPNCPGSVCNSPFPPVWTRYDGMDAGHGRIIWTENGCGGRYIPVDRP